MEYFSYTNCWKRKTYQSSARNFFPFFIIRLSKVQKQCVLFNSFDNNFCFFIAVHATAYSRNVNTFRCSENWRSTNFISIAKTLKFNFWFLYNNNADTRNYGQEYPSIALCTQLNDSLMWNDRTPANKEKKTTLLFSTEDGTTPGFLILIFAKNCEMFLIIDWLDSI